MIEPLSPCKKAECIKRDKTFCSEECLELAAYQRYLERIHDSYTPPAIDPRDPTRAGFLIDEWKFAPAPKDYN